MAEIRISLVAKDVKILQLKMRNQQLSTKGPGSAEALRAENTELKTKVSTLSEEVQGLNAKVNDLTNKLLNVHAGESARMKMLLKSFFLKPPST